MQVQVQTTNPRAAVWFGWVFAIVFGGFGLLAVVIAVKEFGRGKAGTAIAIALFGLIFAAIGFGVLWAVVRARRQSQHKEAIRAENPDTPWLWREDWATGRIQCSSKGTMIGAWVFAFFWNLVSWPILFAFPKELAKGNHAIWIGLLFPAVGIGLLVWAVRATVRWKKFGQSVFEMTAVPGAIGGALTGVLRPGPGVRLMQEFRVRLSCLNRVTTGSGKNRSTSENVLWLDERTVASTTGGGVPILMFIPGDCRETDGRNSDNCIVWRLEATGSVPGVDYAASFEVPVFHAAQTPEQAAQAQAALAERQAVMEAYQRPANSRILVSPALHGGTEFVFSACRNPGSAMALTLFTAVWTVILVVLIVKKAPLIFPVVWTLFELLLVWGLYSIWFGTTRVIAHQGRIEVTHGPIQFGGPKVVSASDIAEIKTSTGMTAGRTTYFDIQVHRRDGKKITAGSAIRDKLEAEWLVAEMRKNLGLSSG